MSLWKRVKYWRRTRTYRKETQAWHDEHDPQENRETTPPSDERISLRCLWVLEYFTPSNVQTLEATVRRRGWDRVGLGNQEVLSTLRRWKEGSSGGWHVIGPFGPRGSGLLGHSAEDDFPEGVGAAQLELHSVTSGVTALLGMFILDDDSSLVLDNAVRRSYKTRIEPIPGGEAEFSPRLLKGQASRDAQRNLAERCFDWMIKGASGSFSRDRQRAPTWQFVTLTKGKPLSDERSEYLQAIGMAHDIAAWQEPTELPGIRLSTPTFYPDDPDMMLLAGNVSDVSGTKGLTPEYLHRLNLQLHATIVTWGTTRLLALSRRNLVGVRHSVALNAGRRFGAAKRLSEARARLLTRGR